MRKRMCDIVTFIQMTPRLEIWPLGSPGRRRGFACGLRLVQRLEMAEWDDLARVCDGIRERVHFAQHDTAGHVPATAQSVVAGFEIVLWRNVLLRFAPSPRLREL